MIFKRNPNYWMKDADGNQLPYLDGMEFIFIGEPSAQVEALRGGQVDYLLYLPSEFVKTIKADPNFAVYEKPSNLAYVIRMRSDRKPFDDNQVRQAFKAGHRPRARSWPRRSRAWASPAAIRPFGPAMATSTWTCPSRRAIRPKRKQLLAEAGYPDGLQVTLTTQQSSPVPAIATILKEQLAEAGIDRRHPACAD